MGLMRTTHTSSLEVLAGVHSLRIRMPYIGERTLFRAKLSHIDSRWDNIRIP